MGSEGFLEEEAGVAPGRREDSRPTLRARSRLGARGRRGGRRRETAAAG